MQNGFEIFVLLFFMKAKVCKFLNRVELKIFYIMKDLLISVPQCFTFSLVSDFCPIQIVSPKNEDNHTENKRGVRSCVLKNFLYT